MLRSLRLFRISWFLLLGANGQEEICEPPQYVVFDLERASLITNNIGAQGPDPMHTEFEKPQRDIMRIGAAARVNAVYNHGIYAFVDCKKFLEQLPGPSTQGPDIDLDATTPKPPDGGTGSDDQAARRRLDGANISNATYLDTVEGKFKETYSDLFKFMLVASSYVELKVNPFYEEYLVQRPGGLGGSPQGVPIPHWDEASFYEEHCQPSSCKDDPSVTACWDVEEGEGLAYSIETTLERLGIELEECAYLAISQEKYDELVALSGGDSVDELCPGGILTTKTEIDYEVPDGFLGGFSIVDDNGKLQLPTPWMFIDQLYEERVAPNEPVNIYADLIVQVLGRYTPRPCGECSDGIVLDRAGVCSDSELASCGILRNNLNKGQFVINVATQDDGLTGDFQDWLVENGNTGGSVANMLFTLELSCCAENNATDGGWAQGCQKFRTYAKKADGHAICNEFAEIPGREPGFFGGFVDMGPEFVPLREGSGYPTEEMSAREHCYVCPAMFSNVGINPILKHLFGNFLPVRIHDIDHDAGVREMFYFPVQDDASLRSVSGVQPFEFVQPLGYSFNVETESCDGKINAVEGDTGCCISKTGFERTTAANFEADLQFYKWADGPCSEHPFQQLADQCAAARPQPSFVQNIKSCRDPDNPGRGRSAVPDIFIQSEEPGAGIDNTGRDGTTVNQCMTNMQAQRSLQMLGDVSHTCLLLAVQCDTNADPPCNPEGRNEILSLGRFSNCRKITVPPPPPPPPQVPFPTCGYGGCDEDGRECIEKCDSDCSRPCRSCNEVDDGEVCTNPASGNGFDCGSNCVDGEYDAISGSSNGCTKANCACFPSQPCRSCSEMDDGEVCTDPASDIGFDCASRCVRSEYDAISGGDDGCTKASCTCPASRVCRSCNEMDDGEVCTSPASDNGFDCASNCVGGEYDAISGSSNGCTKANCACFDEDDTCKSDLKCVGDCINKHCPNNCFESCSEEEDLPCAEPNKLSAPPHTPEDIETCAKCISVCTLKPYPCPPPFPPPFPPPMPSPPALPPCRCHTFFNGVTTESKEACRSSETGKHIDGGIYERVVCRATMGPRGLFKDEPDQWFKKIVDGCPADQQRCAIDYEPPIFEKCRCASYGNGAAPGARAYCQRYGSNQCVDRQNKDAATGGAQFYGCDHDTTPCIAMP